MLDPDLQQTFLIPRGWPFNAIQVCQELPGSAFQRPMEAYACLWVLQGTASFGDIHVTTGQVAIFNPCSVTPVSGGQGDLEQPCLFVVALAASVPNSKQLHKASFKSAVKQKDSWGAKLKVRQLSRKSSDACSCDGGASESLDLCVAGGIPADVLTSSAVVLPDRFYVVHRVWVCPPGVEESLSDLSIASLRSFSEAGFRQVVWHNVTGAQLFKQIKSIKEITLLPVSNVPMYSRHTKHPVPKDVVNFFLENNTPPQLTKDIVTLAAVKVWGGVAADMKLLWFPGRPMPPAGDENLRPEYVGWAKGVVLATEPTKENARKTKRSESFGSVGDRRCTGQVWLGFFSAGELSPFICDVFDKCFDYWLDRSLRVQAGSHPRTDWTVYQPEWMKNTQILHDRAKFYNLIPLPPKCFCALPPWLHSVKNIGTIHYKYYVPTVDELVEDPSVSAVTIWSARQWTEELQQNVFEILSRSLCTSDMRAVTLFRNARAQVRGAFIEYVQPQLRALYDEPELYLLKAKFFQELRAPSTREFLCQCEAPLIAAALVKYAAMSMQLSFELPEAPASDADVDALLMKYYPKKFMPTIPAP